MTTPEVRYIDLENYTEESSNKSYKSECTIFIVDLANIVIPGCIICCLIPLFVYIISQFH